MIQALKNYLNANAEELGLRMTFTEDSFIKTQNGAGHPNKKVVFLVFGKSVPVLTIYASRFSEKNNKLKTTVKTMELMAPTAPTVKFQCILDNLFVTGVEYIPGPPISLTDREAMEEALTWPLLRFSQLNNMTKQPSDFLNELLVELGRLDLKFSASQEEEMKNILKNSAVPLPCIDQHGDYQDNNLRRQNGKIRIIDWDDYGFTNFPLFDFFSLYGKAYKKKALPEKFLGAIWQGWSKKLNLPPESYQWGKTMSLIINFLRKEKLNDSYGLNQRFQRLVSELFTSPE